MLVEKTFEITQGLVFTDLGTSASLLRGLFLAHPLLRAAPPQKPGAHGESRVLEGEPAATGPLPQTHCSPLGTTRVPPGRECV